jgi:hypothetical protein
MRLITIIIILFIGFCGIERELKNINHSLAKIVKLLEAKGE